MEEFRALVSAMRLDLRVLSNTPTADNHTPADVALDFTDLEQYLETRGAGRLAFGAIEQAYIAEYGLSIDRQSCLNFLLFIHADRRSKFTPFGVFSDERYHILEGNEAIARGRGARPEPDPPPEATDEAGKARLGQVPPVVSRRPVSRAT